MTMIREGIFKKGMLQGTGRLIDGTEKILFLGQFNANEVNTNGKDWYANGLGIFIKDGQVKYQGYYPKGTDWRYHNPSYS